jgi:putative transposase
MDATLKLKAEQLASDIASEAKTLDDVNDLFRTLMKAALERMLDTEMDVHLGRTASPALPANDVAPGEPAVARNRRNGHSRKTISGEMGELALDTPRDRQGTFEPQLIAKHQRRLVGFDEKILALYAKGMTTRDWSQSGRSSISTASSSTSAATMAGWRSTRCTWLSA